MAVCGVVPVALCIVPVLLTGAYWHYRGTPLAAIYSAGIVGRRIPVLRIGGTTTVMGFQRYLLTS